LNIVLVNRKKVLIRGFMKLMNTLFSRKQLGQLAGLDPSTLVYWTREGMLRPAEGGGGKGQHRLFARTEVNLAAVLMEMMRAGASAAFMRTLADNFHAAMDWMSERGVTRANAELYGHVLACRQEFSIHGQIEIPDIPDIAEFDNSLPIGQSRERGSREAVRLFSWQQLLAYERAKQGDDALIDGAAQLAETASEDEWRLQHAYFDLLTTPPPRRLASGDPARRFSHFLREDDGSWRIARDIHEAEDHGRFIAIDTNRLFWAIWSAE